MTLSLYFNCRLTQGRLTPDTADAGYFYPVVYPKQELHNHDQYKILIRTLESYSSLSFDVAVFNIEIDGISKAQEYELESLVKNKISAQKKILCFSRPSTVGAWRDDAINLSELVGENAPVLVVMNHDHPFIDYSPTPLMDVIDKVFGGGDVNLGKALYYSHAPEVVSWAINGRGSIMFSRDKGLYTSSIINDWIDSICILTPATLRRIWSKLRYSEEYIGRLDWVGATYSDLGITTYVSPREFFKHYDGYSHISGLRLMTDLAYLETLKVPLPPAALIPAVDFYYQRWIDTYLLAIRDYLKATGTTTASPGMKYRKILEHTLTLMHAAYLGEDARLGLIEKYMVGEIYNGLRNKVYFNANHLFIEIYTDILLIKPSLINSIKLKIYSVYKNLILKTRNKFIK
jgi:hypothetical protein